MGRIMRVTTPTAGCRRRHLAAQLAGAGLALALVAGCSTGGGEGSSESGSSEGGTLVYATGDAEPDCLDPHVGGNYPQALISTQYLEPLVGRDSDGEMQPWLATDWKVSEDGLTWDFTLAEGVTFTDGTPFDAAAVKANIEHLKDPDTASSTGYLAVEKVESVEAVDDTHVRFHLSEPDSALLESLSMPWTAMESPAGIERGMDANCAAPIGTGPYAVDEWVPQQHVILERNEDYATPGPEASNAGPAHVERIEWRFSPDPATRWAALQSGEVNMIDNPEPQAIVAAESSPQMNHIDAPRPGSVNRIELNSAQAPFDDERVRQAFILAADPNPGIESLYQGVVARSYSPLSSVEPDAFSEPDLFTPDADEADRPLDDAGRARSTGSSSTPPRPLSTPSACARPSPPPPTRTPGSSPSTRAPSPAPTRPCRAWSPTRSPSPTCSPPTPTRRTASSTRPAGPS